METIIEKNYLLKTFEKNFEQNTLGKEIDTIRKESFQTFIQQGFPTKKTEDYKYLLIEKYITDNLSVGVKNTAEKAETSTQKSFNTMLDLTIVNGNLLLEKNKEIETPQLYIANIQQAFAKHFELINQFYLKSTANTKDAFALLNNAFAKNTLFIYVKKNATIDAPINIHHIVNVNSAFINQRALIIVEENAICTFYENIKSSNSETSIYNSLTEVFVKQNANLQHIKFESNNNNLVIINNQETTQSKNSVVNNFTFTINGLLTRNNTNILLNNEYVESHLYGAYIANKNSVIDNHTLVNHAFPNCNSNELYKGVANDKATAIFNGKIYVKKDAQKTNAFQSNKNILLSNDAIINTKPQLEIYADDVKCSHGTSTGKLDDNALFYLRARGIGEQSAKKLLLQAFVNETCEPIKQQDIKEYLLNILHASIE